MLDRLTSMAVFVKAADAGSFTAAGVALGLTSQMVGKHVAALEQQVGASMSGAASSSPKRTPPTLLRRSRPSRLAVASA